MTKLDMHIESPINREELEVLIKHWRDRGTAALSVIDADNLTEDRDAVKIALKAGCKIEALIEKWEGGEYE